MDERNMKFNRNANGWYIYEGGLYLRELMHGVGLFLQVGETYYCTRLEWDDEEWLVTLGKRKFWLHHKTQYRIILF
jgi:hypothetical protein